MARGDTLRVDKLVTIATSRDVGEQSDVPIRGRCLDELAERRAEGLDDCFARSTAAWDRMWTDTDCEIVGDAEATKAVRFSIYHLLIAAKRRGPDGQCRSEVVVREGYRGHVFWDTEILVLPFFTYTQPATARALLRYRHQTLPGARELSRENGTRGARYAWESADTGREECPQFTPDGANRFWTREEEVHVSADVAYGTLTYVAATGDTAFLVEFGAEILFETSRFWTSRVGDSATGDGFELKQVIGPDEFHSHVDNNAFTNRMVKWHLTQAAQVYETLRADHPDAFLQIVSAIALEPEEVDRWRSVAAGTIAQPVSEHGVIEQFDGYFRRDDIPVTEWDENDMPRYPKGYNHFNCESVPVAEAT